MNPAEPLIAQAEDALRELIAQRPCEAIVPVSPNVLVVCCQPSTGTWQYACVHEHVRTANTCDLHTPRPDQVGCLPCFKAGHDCEMTYRRIG